MIINASESVEILDGVFREDGSRVTSGFFSSVGLANDREINENATGEGGDITVNTGRLVVRNAQLTATTFAQGEGGSLIIDVEELSIQDGGQVGVGSIGEGVSGNGGELKVTASQLIEIFGTGLDFTLPGETELRPVNSRLFAQSEGTGDAGNIEVDLNSTGEMTVRDRATISVNAEGTGTAGDIIIEEANHITLDQGEITATSFSGNGGNIDLTIRDRLSLSNNSTISTTAGERQNAGDGGNVTINTSFLVARDNSDITANAFKGDGGNITLIAEGILGITPREEITPLSDITASSQFGQEGVIEIETPETDPASTLTTLPEEEVNVEFARACARSPEQSLAFYNLGRGGLPPTPDRFLTITEGMEWLALPSSESDDRAESVTTQPLSFASIPLFPACASQESTPPN
jgi:large exoprotein involved in heme utilization and adhesion